MPADVLLYTKASCPFCVRAKALLEARAIAYRDIPVDGDDDLREEVRARYDWPTVPVVVIDGRCVGGYTDLARLDASGQLASLVGR